MKKIVEQIVTSDGVYISTLRKNRKQKIDIDNGKIQKFCLNQLSDIYPKIFKRINGYIQITMPLKSDIIPDLLLDLKNKAPKHSATMDQLNIFFIDAYSHRENMVTLLNNKYRYDLNLKPVEEILSVDINNMRKEIINMDSIRSMRYKNPFKLIELSPNKYQQNIIDLMFRVMEIIQTIANNKIDEDFDKKLELLKYKNDFYSVLGEKNWVSHVDLLDVFLNNYIQSDRVYLAFSNIRGCSLSKENNVFINMEKLGMIKIANNTELNQVLNNYKKQYNYSDSFSLIKLGKKVFVKINFLDKKTPKKPIPKDSENAIQKAFDKFIKMIYQEELLESKRFAKIDFNQLEGRSVQGGGIEMSKRK